jgi:hypothetical protein
MVKMFSQEKIEEHHLNKAESGTEKRKEKYRFD